MNKVQTRKGRDEMPVETGIKKLVWETEEKSRNSWLLPGFEGQEGVQSQAL